MKVDFNYNKTLFSAKSLPETFAYFTNYGTLFGEHFPEIQKFEPRGNGYYWEFSELNFGGKKFQVRLVTQFHANKPKQIAIRAVPGEGSGDLEGKITFKEQGGGTSVDLRLDLKADLPVPFFLSKMISPLIDKELGKLFDEFVQNVESALR